ncbi:MAG: hypothetical protein ABIV06_02720 [Thermoanaerobaculia bacterium]
MSRLPRFVQAGAFAALALGFAAAAEAREVYEGRLLPESGGASRRLSIIVDEFTSPAESERLQELLRTKGQRALEKALGKLEVGRIQIGDLQSYPIATATVFENRELNTRRVLLLISRPISYGEFARGGHSIDYPYTLVELALDGPGIDDGGSGEMLALARIALAPDGSVQIENLEARPRRILKVSRSE